MADGHRSWRWTATRYEVACVRLLDSRDIRASVWVFPTKSNAKIAIGWAELASSVTTPKKKCSTCDDFVLAWKNDDLMENARQNQRRCRYPCRGSHRQNKTGQAFLFCVQFSSVHFYLAKIYNNTGIHIEIVSRYLRVFLGVREDWGLGWGAREVSWEGKKTPRAPQPNPQSSLTPRKHLNSDWVRVCRRLMKPGLPSPKKNILKIGTKQRLSYVMNSVTRYRKTFLTLDWKDYKERTSQMSWCIHQ